MSLRFDHGIRSRKVRACAILAALSILVILIAAVLMPARRAPNRLQCTTCMACWIKWFPAVGTDHAL